MKTQIISFLVEFNAYWRFHSFYYRFHFFCHLYLEEAIGYLEQELYSKLRAFFGTTPLGLQIYPRTLSKHQLEPGISGEDQSLCKRPIFCSRQRKIVLVYLWTPQRY